MGYIAQTYVGILRRKNWGVIPKSEDRQLEQNLTNDLKDLLELSAISPALGVSVEPLEFKGKSSDVMNDDEGWRGLALYWFGSPDDLQNIADVADKYDLVLQGTASLGGLAEGLFHLLGEAQPHEASKVWSVKNLEVDPKLCFFELEVDARTWAAKAVEKGASKVDVYSLTELEFERTYEQPGPDNFTYPVYTKGFGPHIKSSE